MLNPLDLNRLALRIEGLVQTSTYGWSPGDEWDMRRLLPDPRDQEGRLRLPHPDRLRAAAKGTGEESSVTVSLPDYHKWLRWCMDLEHHKTRNHPSHPHRVMRDMARGRFPL